MSNPLELIRIGCETRDWTKVAVAYKAMTGSKVTIGPKQPEPALIKQQHRNIGLVKDHLQVALALLGDAIMPATEEGPQPEPEPEPQPVAVTTKKKRGRPKMIADMPKDHMAFSYESEETEETEEPPEPQTTKQLLSQDDPMAQFRVEQGEPLRDGSRLARVVPLDKPVNLWVDDRSEATEELAESISLSKKFSKRKKEFRPSEPMVDVKCAGCRKKDKVPMILAPRRADKDDDEPSWLCNTCIKRRKRE